LEERKGYRVHHREHFVFGGLIKDRPSFGPPPAPFVPEVSLFFFQQPCGFGDPAFSAPEGAKKGEIP